MTTPTYPLGATRRFTATFTSLAGEPADPSTISVQVRRPSGVKTEYVYLTDAEVVKSSTGVFYIDVELALPGRYVIRWLGDSTLDSAGETEIYAVRSEAGA